MEYIRTPIRPGLSGEKTCALYDIDDKMIAFNPFRSVGPVLNEIVQAVNKYEALVAQRDALVEALEMAAFELDSIIDQKGHTGLTRGIRDTGYAVLALVKGDQKSDDATT